jgi:L-arabinose transport system substrate-binding protein
MILCLHRQSIVGKGRTMLSSGVRPANRRFGTARIRALVVVSLTALIFGVPGVSAQDSTPNASPAASSTALPADLAAGLTFGLIQKSGDQQYFVDEAQGFREIVEGAGGKVIVQDVQLDSNAAISAMDTMIAAGVSGIAIVVPDQAIGPAVIEKAAAAGIPLIAQDDSITDAQGNPAPLAGFDGVDMGTSVGKEVVRLWQDAGSPTDGVGALSVEVQTLSVCNDRTNASRGEMTGAGFPEDQIFAVPYDGTSPAAIDAAATIITAHPEITTWFVWGCNDEGVQGTIRALESAGITADNTYAVGLGAYLACAEWKSGNPTGFRAALYISGLDVGRTGATALILAATKGEPLPQQVFAPTYMTTPENYVEAGVTC